MLMYMKDPKETVQLNSSPGLAFVIAVTAVAVLFIGILPSNFLIFARLAISAF
jgi:NADH:ubiquinone oxidoreductase subunit 2 (subunit N)